MKFFQPEPNSNILELGEFLNLNAAEINVENSWIDSIDFKDTDFQESEEPFSNRYEKHDKRKNVKIVFGKFGTNRKYDYILIGKREGKLKYFDKLLQKVGELLSDDGSVFMDLPIDSLTDKRTEAATSVEQLKKVSDRKKLTVVEISEENGRIHCHAIKKKNIKIYGLLRVRNEEHLILDTLNHLSTFCNGGIFVYDDCSNDRTPEICEKYPNVIKVIRGKTWDKNRERAEYENRAAILNEAKKIASVEDWFVYLDADERIEYDWKRLYFFPNDVIAVRMKLFDFYITPEDVAKPYYERKKIGPEYRKIIMAFRNLPTLEYKYMDQREVVLGKEGVIAEEGYVRHYGKAVSVEEWEKTCDYYANHFPKYSEKWKKRKGKAIHHNVSDFGNPLITWDEKEIKGIDLSKIEQGFNVNTAEKKKLKILLTTHHLLDFTGSEIFAYTLAENFKKQNCEVYVYSKYVDKLKNYFDKINVPVIEHLEAIKNVEFDIAQVSHNINAIEVRNIFPELPIVYLSHGVIPFLEQPPSMNVNIFLFLALSDEIKNKLLSFGIPESKVRLFPNMVNQNLFKENTPINNSPERILVISNKIDESTEDIINGACAQLNIDVKFIGKRFEVVEPFELPTYINQSDIVITLGRGAIEAMFCGRVPIILDYLAGDGMVTPANFEELAKFNFSGRRFNLKFSTEDLINEIGKYKAEYGRELRKIALEKYSAANSVSRLIELYHEVLKKKQLKLSKEDGQLVEFVSNMILETRFYTEETTNRKIKLLFDETTIGLWMQNAEELIEKNKIAEAKKILQLIKNYYPENVKALNNLAVVNILEGNTEDAKNILENVLRIDPQDKIAKGNLEYLLSNLNV